MEILDDRTRDTLLAKYQIAGVPHGSSAKATTHGGLVASVEIVRDGEDAASMRVTIGDHSVARMLPLGENQTKGMLTELRAAHPLTHDASFEHLMEHLLLKTSRLYWENDLERLHFGAVHLHQSAYSVGQVKLWRGAVIHARPRLAKDAHDRGAMSAHQGPERPR